MYFRVTQRDADDSATPTLLCLEGGCLQHIDGAELSAAQMDRVWQGVDYLRATPNAVAANFADLSVARD
jgi:hypothetical protein